MSKGTPGDFYRHLVRSFFPEDKRATVEGDELVSALEAALLETAHEDAPSFGRYIAATGLLACGRADMVELVLSNVPEPTTDDEHSKVLYLGTNALRALLPLPQALQGDGGWYSYPDLEGVRAWWDDHRDRLEWDSEHERFVLSDPVGSSAGT